MPYHKHKRCTVPATFILIFRNKINNTGSRHVRVCHNYTLKYLESSKTINIIYSPGAKQY